MLFYEGRQRLAWLSMISPTQPVWCIPLTRFRIVNNQTTSKTKATVLHLDIFTEINLTVRLVTYWKRISLSVYYWVFPSCQCTYVQGSWMMFIEIARHGVVISYFRGLSSPSDLYCLPSSGLTLFVPCPYCSLNLKTNLGTARWFIPWLWTSPSLRSTSAYAMVSLYPEVQIRPYNWILTERLFRLQQITSFLSWRKYSLQSPRTK